MFGSALLQPARSVCVSLGAFFPYIGSTAAIRLLNLIFEDDSLLRHLQTSYGALNQLASFIRARSRALGRVYRMSVYVYPIISSLSSAGASVGLLGYAQSV